MSSVIAPAPEFLSGGGEMGARMRAKEWSSTPLGSPESWPQSLQIVIRIMLNSRYAMWLAWGRDLTFFCNDAYRPTLGIKQGWALGVSARQVWAEIWPDIGPRIDTVMRTGAATWDEALLLFLQRSGFPEETYHTFSYGPVAADDGRITGMLCVVTEETERVIGERRMSLLRELASEIGAARTVQNVSDAVRRSLGAYPTDLPFTLTYLFDPDGSGRASLVSTSGVPEGHEAAPAAIDAAPGGLWPLDQMVERSGPVLLNDLASRFSSTLPRGAWDRPPAQAVIVPIAQQGQQRPAGALIAGINPYRRYDTAYAGFIGLLAGQIASGFVAARAYDDERRRAESLAEIDRAKTLFFSNISHEFRTPLTLMMSPLEELLSTADGMLTESAKELATVAHRNSLRLLRLVNTLLDFSRIEAKRVQANYRPLDLAEVTIDLASSFRSAIERAGLELLVDCPPLPERAVVDPEMWEKIVLNLLSNAFKFTFEGRISVRLRADDDAALLEVEDTGTGIPEQERARVFERFHRVEGARGRSYEGSGIGLALVKDLVALHGGSVAVESTLGQGSCFRVRIPTGKEHLSPDDDGEDGPLPASTSTRAAAFVEEALRWIPDAGPDLSIPAAHSPVPSGPRPRILLADDNADLRDYVGRLLATRYVVEAVPDGAVALERARLDPPDLVLSDVMMPRLDSFGLLKGLRADPATHDIPIILLSARAGDEAQVEGLDAGADDYVVKPFSARELLARVAANLAAARERSRALHVERALRGELQRERDRLLVALEAARMATFDWDTASGELTSQGDLAGLWGSAEPTLDLAGSSVHPDDRETLRAAIAATVSSGTPLRSEFRRLGPDGCRWVSLIGRVDRAPEGNSVITGVMIDISERKQAELELQERESRLRLLTDAMPALISYVDSDRRYRFVNHRFEEWFKQPRKKLQAQHVRKVLGKAGYQLAVPYVERVLAGERVNFEMVVTTPGMGRRDIAAAYIPDLGATGNVVGYHALERDITDAKRRETRQRFRVGLADALRPLEEPGAVMAKAAKRLSRHLEVSRVGYGEVDSAQEYITVEHDWADGTVSVAGRHLMSDFGPAVIAELRSGRTIAIADVTMDPRTADIGAKAFESIKSRAVLAVPLIKQQRMVAMLFLHHADPRAWSLDDIELVEEVADRTWSAVDAARALAALRQSEERLRLAVEAGGMGIWDLDLRTGTLQWDASMHQLLGTDPASFVPSEHAFYDLVHPLDRERVRARGRRIASNSREHGAVDDEFRVAGSGSDPRWLAVRARQITDAAGLPTRLIGVDWDVTSRKRADQRQRLLMNELNHRVKNTLATVQSIANQTLRGDALAEHRRSLEARLIAMSQAHNVLTSESWEGADLHDMVALALNPHQLDGQPRHTALGPSLRLKPKAAMAMAMAMHELATNAAKYGALSDPRGRVHVSWLLDGAAEPELLFTWKEQDGPPIQGEPSRRGFGSRLIERGLKLELGGDVRLVFDHKGLICTVKAPAMPVLAAPSERAGTID